MFFGESLPNSKTDLCSIPHRINTRVVSHACNPSTSKVEEGRSGIGSQPGLNETLSVATSSLVRNAPKTGRKKTSSENQVSAAEFRGRLG